MSRFRRVGDALIDAYCTHLARVGRRPRTVRQRRKVLTHLAGQLPVGLLDATPGQVDAWVNRAGLKPDTRLHYLAAAVDFYGWAVETGRIEASPAARIPRPRTPRHLPRPIPAADLARALRFADCRTALWLRLGALAGLRCCEIAELHAEDAADGLLFIRGQKGGGVGCVPLHATLADALAAWPVKSGPLWPSVTADYVSQRCNAVLHRSGSASTMHATRHKFATDLLARTDNLRVVQTAMRHASPTTTAIYTLVEDASVRAAVAGLPVPA